MAWVGLTFTACCVLCTCHRVCGAQHPPAQRYVVCGLYALAKSCCLGTVAGACFQSSLPPLFVNGMRHLAVSTSACSKRAHSSTLLSLGPSFAMKC